MEKTKTIGILGVVHNNELRMQTGLTIELIRELITEFDPDVICGEVLPVSWDRYKREPAERGYWGEPPSEYYDLIFPLCEEKGIDFVPIDWIELDVWNDFDPLRKYEGEARARLEQEDEKWWQRQLEGAGQGNIPFNTAAFDEATRLKYKRMAELDPEAYALRWTHRHLIMVQRIRNAIKRNPDKRILCIVGADHNHLLNEELRRAEGSKVIYPLR
ncbi:DUF5694 domain-containing protein [Saccharibacillus alkalitolerans]|uniref:Uncharacterized protein n=1 Tax=Saccharibacillus alkalitolerans TaxID=2705290 RepID=A0ABX0F568_9BACL|nr:DUF5694 domain-containing protein [Saccharibacillus alkalitolerans]NGZ74699.1 hypothetical protein [Saccharibacillus alkalitolerans]